VPNAHASPSRRLGKIGGPNGAHFQNVDAIGRTWNCERNAYNWKLNGATRIGAVNGKGVVRTVDAVMARLRAEFMEMPGLRLTGARVVLKLRSWISHSPALTRLIARSFARMRRRPRACPRGAYCERAPRFARSASPRRGAHSYGASSEQIMPWHAPVTTPSLSPRSLVSLRRAAHVTKVARR
jgi:hypothetical protein